MKYIQHILFFEIQVAGMLRCYFSSVAPRTPPRSLPSMVSPAATPEIHNLATLVDTLAQATSIIQAAGLTMPALTSSTSRGLAGE